MSGLTFVDTNVLVYARDLREPQRQLIAHAWLERLWAERSGRIGMQILSEYYVTVTRKLKPGLIEEQAWDDVEAFLQWQPQPIDRETMQRGRIIQARYQLSWWDSLVVAAARQQGCATLLTEDLQEGSLIDGVRIVNPFSYSVQEVRAESYADDGKVGATSEPGKGPRTRARVRQSSGPRRKSRQSSRNDPP